MGCSQTPWAKPRLSRPTELAQRAGATPSTSTPRDLVAGLIEAGQFAEEAVAYVNQKGDKPVSGQKE